jgi:hypothetical protein
MKLIIKFFWTALLTFLAFQTCAQGGWLKPNSSYGNIANRISLDSTFFFPTGCGSPSLRGYNLHKAALYYDSCAGLLWIYNPKLVIWDTVTTSSFSGSGITSLNGSSDLSQSFSTGTSGSDFNISTAGSVHTFNIPTASATKRGLLSTTDWSTFNGKIGPGDTSAMLSPYLRSNVAAATYTPLTRSISTTYPLQGGGDLSTDHTFNLDTSAGHWRSQNFYATNPFGYLTATPTLQQVLTAGSDINGLDNEVHIGNQYFVISNNNLWDKVYTSWQGSATAPSIENAVLPTDATKAVVATMSANSFVLYNKGNSFGSTVGYPNFLMDMSTTGLSGHAQLGMGKNATNTVTQYEYFTENYSTLKTKWFNGSIYKGGVAGTDSSEADLLYYNSATPMPEGLHGSGLHVRNTIINADVDVTVPAEAYGVAWSGSFEAPTKGDLYTKIETLIGSAGNGITDSSGRVIGGGIVYKTTDLSIEDTAAANIRHYSIHANDTYQKGGIDIGTGTGITRIRIGSLKDQDPLGRLTSHIDLLDNIFSDSTGFRVVVGGYNAIEMFSQASTSSGIYNFGHRAPNQDGQIQINEQTGELLLYFPFSAGANSNDKYLIWNSVDNKVYYRTINATQSTIQFKDEGTNLGATGTVSSVDFVGSGVTASRSGNAVTVTIPGGGSGTAVDTIYRTQGKDSIQFTIAGRYHAILDSLGSGGGSTPGIDDVLGVAQSLTTDRTIATNGHSLLQTGTSTTFFSKWQAVGQTPVGGLYGDATAVGFGSTNAAKVYIMYNGNAVIGISGNNTGMGGLASPTAYLDLPASIFGDATMRMRPGVRPSTLNDGESYNDGTDHHLYMYLNGTYQQLDNYGTYQTISSGSSSTLNDGTTNVLFNPASDLGTYTLTLPPSPTDGQTISITFGGTVAAGSPVVTTFTLSPNTGQSLYESITPTQGYGGDDIELYYKSSNTTWYRTK